MAHKEDGAQQKNKESWMQGFMVKDLTVGPPLRVIVSFAVPMVIGNIFQQLYNVVDTIIVGRYVGTNALAAVGSSFTLMTFITSVLLGLCMGTAVVFAQFFGAKRYDELKLSISTSFVFIGAASLLICGLSIWFIDGILAFMNTPPELVADTKSYLVIIFSGIVFTFLYNWSAGLLRALGNSKVPLYFLIAAALTNVVLDLLFVVTFEMGIAGAAVATVIAQALSAVLCVAYCVKKLDFLQFKRGEFRFDKEMFQRTASYSVLTSVQQSIMSFGILMVQGLINSFGAPTMAALAAAVKIDQFAYMPVQDFGNAFSTYIAQNKGAQKHERIREGIKVAVVLITASCIVISALVWLFSDQLMLIFLKPTETEIIAIGARYLRIVGAFYCFIGYLFLFYGLYRALGNVSMSIVLTIVSLGTRIVLAYAFAPSMGIGAVCWAIPIGWLLADTTGLLYYRWVQSKIPLGGLE